MEEVTGLRTIQMDLTFGKITKSIDRQGGSNVYMLSWEERRENNH